jgi:hypothetical protein
MGSAEQQTLHHLTALLHFLGLMKKRCDPHAMWLSLANCTPALAGLPIWEAASPELIRRFRMPILCGNVLGQIVVTVFLLFNLLQAGPHLCAAFCDLAKTTRTSTLRHGFFGCSWEYSGALA